MPENRKYQCAFCKDKGYYKRKFYPVIPDNIKHLHAYCTCIMGNHMHKKALMARMLKCNRDESELVLDDDGLIK